MSGTYIKVNGEWRLLPQDIKKNGSWEDITNAWIKENGAWTLYRTENVPVEYLVVAGGGGGSSNNAGWDPAGGGGGAGGYLTNVYGQDKPGTSTDGGTTVTEDTNWVPFTLTKNVYYPLSVGAGGSRGNSSAKGGYGGNSTFASIISTGGGGGGGVGDSGNPGGSGGGKGCHSGTGAGSATGVSGQGRRGGRWSASGNQGAGGGGAGQYPNTSSKGGDGLYNNITGTSTAYAGGGGSYAGSGGVGGGGNGGTSGVGGDAPANTGGGGGGSGNIKATGGGGKKGGLGGSGVVIFRIPVNYTAVFDAGITYTEDTSSVLNYRVYTVTGGTGTFTIADELVYYITADQENLNLETYIGSTDYSSFLNKRVIISSGVTLGATSTSNYALNIPSGFGGKITVINYGSILGQGGAGGTSGSGSDGGPAIFAGASNISISNFGTIYAGGGGGGQGGTGGDGTYDATYAASICTCPVCCGYSCTDSAPCTGGYTNQPNNGCAEGGWRWFCPATGNSSGTAGGNGGKGAGYGNSAVAGSSASNAVNNAGNGGDGGDGGAYGTNGYDGDTGANGNSTTGLAGKSGGFAGYYIVNNGNVTWISTGTVAGRVG